MKKILFLLITGLTVSVSHSQDVSDALRYSQDNITGTARFRAMSGAFGAVGGDLSATTVNPAGSAIFNNNQVGITLSNQNINNGSKYFNDGETQDKDNSFILNQAGGVFVFKDRNPNNKGWNKIAIGASYENTNNFNNNTFSAGRNPNNSIANYFLSYANGTALGDATKIPYADQFYYEQQTGFGVNGKIILPVNPNDDENTQYTSNVPGLQPGQSYYQENNIYERGYNSKVSFNIATSYNDRIYFGANLNVHVTDYRRSSSFYEFNNAPLTGTPTISDVTFNNELYTYGNGFSFQLGAIAKVTEAFRLGLAYESNTWYELYDELSQSVYTTTEATGGVQNFYNLNPNTINVYEPYTLQTPGKFTFSGAYIFGKSGLISVDYSIKDYSNAKFKPTNDPDFRTTNGYISDELTTNGELRVGAEFKIKQLSLRGGYRFEGSPYKNGTTVGDLNSFSAGLGYNFGATKLDLAYAYAERKSNQGFFSQGFTDGANITSTLNNVSLTLLFEL
ncbi:MULTISPECIES: OmpP1/FadL family transporter [Flavobacterium]|uniref:OmpP1/FadL family transporter n=1 Tax=Flavobacterium TaxID=237 RepID=UPI002114A447|nr:MULTISPECIES: outer membrane protein transport protein [Flavobacterium]UUF14380.1 outer membrane protein transport protein [Flavobacterium panici]